MLNLSAADRTKLKAIVAAGGLRDLRDMVRISIAPEHPEDMARWKNYLDRNGDMLLHWVQQACDSRDIVLFDGAVFTIIRHPQSTPDTGALRATLIAQLTDRLCGNTTISLPRLVFKNEAVHAAMGWLAGAVASAAAAPPQPAPAPKPTPAPVVTREAEVAAEALQASPSKPGPQKARLNFDLSDMEASDPARFRFQAVARADGTAVLFLRLAPQGGELDPRAYFSPGEEFAELDIGAIREAAHYAFRQVRQKRQASTPVMLPLNINNLRHSERRRQLLFELRQIPKAASGLIEPVFVRCVDGLPQSALLDAAAYLRPMFQRFWVFVHGRNDPAKFKWPDFKMGVLVDGLAELEINARLRRVSEWVSVAGRGGAPVAILSVDRHPDTAFDDVTDTIHAAM